MKTLIIIICCVLFSCGRYGKGWYTFKYYKNYTVYCEAADITFCGVIIYNCNDNSDHICVSEVVYQQGDPKDMKFKKE